MIRQNNQFVYILFRIYGNDDRMNFDTRHTTEANGNPKNHTNLEKEAYIEQGSTSLLYV